MGMAEGRLLETLMTTGVFVATEISWPLTIATQPQQFVRREDNNTNIVRYDNN
jgi:hypothetical protein